ncbi:MAG: protein kinase [Pseudomonadota bacterium]|nr:protein kinase [Pseudomonadota bacterium]
MIKIQTQGLAAATQQATPNSSPLEHLSKIKPLFEGRFGPLSHAKAVDPSMQSTIASKALFHSEPVQDSIEQLMDDITNMLDMKDEPQTRPEVGTPVLFDGNDLKLPQRLTAFESHGLQSYARAETHNAIYFNFLNNRPWTVQDQHNLTAALQLRCAQSPEYSQKDQQLIGQQLWQTVKSIKPQYTLDNRGSYFKKTGIHQMNGMPTFGTTNSIVKTFDGHIFELLNSPTPKQQHMIKDLGNMDVPAGKLTLGASSEGRVCLARNLNTNEIVVVKKFKSRENAVNEIKKYRSIQPMRGLCSLRSYALSDHADSNGQVKQSNYIFLKLANDGDGIDFTGRLNFTRAQDPAGALKTVFETAFKYIDALANLHSQNIFHRDIKPDNYGHSKDGDVTLLDFGTTETGNAVHQYQKLFTGSPAYIPPEHYKGNAAQGEQHDAWALGATLLLLKNGDYAKNTTGPHLHIKGEEIYLELHNKYSDTDEIKTDDVKGISRRKYPFQNLKYETLDEVIAGLLDKRPETRLTPRQALNTPLFKAYALSKGSIHVSAYEGAPRNVNRLEIE